MWFMIGYPPNVSTVISLDIQLKIAYLRQNVIWKPKTVVVIETDGKMELQKASWEENGIRIGEASTIKRKKWMDGKMPANKSIV